MTNKVTPIFLVVVLAAVIVYGIAFMIQAELTDTLCTDNGWDYGTVDWKLDQFCGYDYSLHPEPNGDIVNKPDRLVPLNDALKMFQNAVE